MGALLILLFAGLLAGCSSKGSKDTTGSHAGITIKGHDVTDVVLTTRDVFADHDFVLAKAEPDRMVFERPGTRGEQIKYGSFSSPDVTIRAKVDLQELGPKMFFLRCDFFAVRDAGDSVIEDETKLILFSNKHFQEIMDEVKTRLDAQPVSSAPSS